MSNCNFALNTLFSKISDKSVSSAIIFLKRVKTRDKISSAFSSFSSLDDLNTMYFISLNLVFSGVFILEIKLYRFSPLYASNNQFK